MKEKEASGSSIPLVNEQIRFARVQVIASNGQNVGVISRNEALGMARDEGLDLVLISDNGAEGVPVAKVMDFGKALYAKKKKMVEAKKHQKVIQIKEIKLRPKIGEHDFRTKLAQVIQFLKDGNRVKITLMFRGREQSFAQVQGGGLFERIDKELENAGLTVAHEKESKLGAFWVRIYYLKK